MFPSLVLCSTISLIVKIHSPQMSEFHLQSAHLDLRELTLDDAAFTIALLNSPSWLAYIGDRGVRDEAQAIQYLQNGPIRSYAHNRFGLLRVSLRETGEPIGMCGLIKRAGLSQPDIGFAFLPEYEGKGYGFEAAMAVLADARDRLALPEVLAITMATNPRSIQLLLRLGMKAAGLITLPGELEVLQLYRWLTTDALPAALA